MPYKAAFDTLIAWISWTWYVAGTCFHHCFCARHKKEYLFIIGYQAIMETRKQRCSVDDSFMH